MKLKYRENIFCTYFDKNYLPKGLSMYASLIKHNPQARLWILCMDDYTKNFLDQLHLKGVKTIALSQFEDKELIAAKQNRNLVEYYWTCTPSLPLYFFRRDSKVKTITYLDADLYFFSSVEPVFKELGNGSIYAVEHRFPRGQENRVETSGRFNVAFQIFRRDKEGLACLRRWRKQCLEWCYWRLEDGKLGDQLYLNEWPGRYKHLVISKNLGVNAAPWNINQFRISSSEGEIYVNKDRLLCYHFHQFAILAEKKFENSTGYRIAPPVEQHIYKPYQTEIAGQIEILRRFDESFNVSTRRDIVQIIRGLIAKLISPIYWRIKSYG